MGLAKPSNEETMLRRSDTLLNKLDFPRSAHWRPWLSGCTRSLFSPRRCADVQETRGSLMSSQISHFNDDKVFFSLPLDGSPEQ